MTKENPTYAINWEPIFEGTYDINGVKARWISEEKYEKLLEENKTLRMWLKASESGNKLLWEENELLKRKLEITVETLEFYAEFSNWHGEIKHRGNNHFTDFSRTDLEQFEGHMVCGKRARQALKEIARGINEIY